MSGGLKKVSIYDLGFGVCRVWQLCLLNGDALWHPNPKRADTEATGTLGNMIITRITPALGGKCRPDPYSSISWESVLVKFEGSLKGVRLQVNGKRPSELPCPSFPCRMKSSKGIPVTKLFSLWEVSDRGKIFPMLFF